MRACSRCKQIKDDASFKHGKRISSHCWHCRCEVRNESRRRYPERVRADAMVNERGRGNPEAFAYLTAKHIEAYLDNAIKRWERSYGSEVHPNLTAIRQLASNLTAQPPTLPGPPAPRQCEHCGETFNPNLVSQRYCCKAHARTARSRRKYATMKATRPPRPQSKTALEQQQRQERSQRLLPITQAQALAKDIEADIVLLYRALGIQWQVIANTFGYRNPGSVYALTHYRSRSGLPSSDSSG